MFLGRDMIKRIPWLQLFIEAVLLVLSVFLALALNSWRQNETHEKLASQAIRNIKSEVTVNKKEIEETLSYHKMLIDTLLKGDASPGMAIKTAFIQNSAWETAQAVQAVTYLDYAIASQASKIHELQETYKQIVQASVQALYVGSNSDRERVILPMLYDLRFTEQRLLKSYEQFLTMVGE